MLYRKENVHGGDIYRDKIELDYSVNVNPLGTPPAVVQAVRQCAPRIGSYPDPSCAELVSAIAVHEKVREEQILCGNGAAELIYAFCQAAGPRKALVTAPSFAEYELALAGTGCETGRYYLRADRGFRLEEGFLSFLKTYRPDTVFLCNPNNPDGREISRDLLLKILGLGRDLSVRFLVDECFADLSDHQITVKDVLDQFPNVFLLKAFTKNYAMAGIRLGYGLCSDTQFLGNMAETVQPWNISLPAQEAGIAALKDREIIPKARKIIAAQRPWLSNQLSELGFQVCPSQANYILFRKTKAPDLDARLRQKGIAIRNCANFPGLGKGWYRIAVKREEENRRFIEVLRDVLQEMGI